MSKQLKVRKDGSFKIVQFSDTEFCIEGPPDPSGKLNDDDITRQTMENIIRLEQPDLIVFAGDVIASEHAKDPIGLVRKAADIVERSKIPWTMVFGNHDSESDVPRIRLHETQLEYSYNVASPDPVGVSGAGNYYITINDENGQAAFALYFMDSGDYTKIGDRIGGYDWIHRDQINWYTEQAAKFKKANGGEPLPSLAFFHIPFPEYNEVWDFHTCYGHRLDGDCYSPRINSGLFTAMLEMGDIVGTFVGHDHANDFCGTLHGIQLCYGRSTRYVSYVDGKRKDHFPTGARIIELQAGRRQFKTWITEKDGHVVTEQPEHLPEGRPI